MVRFFGWSLSFLAILALTLATGQELKKPELSDYEVLSQVIAKKTIPGLLILDVRTEALYLKGHIPGAVNLPLARLLYENPTTNFKAVIVVYGRPVSAEAVRAVDILQNKGFQNVILFGSISKWKGTLE